MSTIVVDENLRDRLLAAGGRAELRDASGRLIGRFVAIEDATQYEVEGLDVTDEELDRREREEPRYTAEQVIDRLRGLR